MQHTHCCKKEAGLIYFQHKIHCLFYHSLMQTKQLFALGNFMDHLKNINKKHSVQTKAMQKTGFSWFLCFAKDRTDLFSYSNLKRK
jgi:hypothetical protein